jgi:hypothetical protein
VLRALADELDGLADAPAQWAWGSWGSRRALSERDDLAVDHREVGLHPQACRRDPRVHPGEVLVLP